MKLTKLSPDTQSILSKMGDRRGQLDELIQQFAAIDPTEVDKVRRIQTQVLKLLRTAA